MEVPWRCSACHHENMVDLERLIQWPLGNLVTAEGFVCEACEAREAVSYSTPSLVKAAEKLTRYRPDQEQFHWLFAKLLRKARGIREHGASLWRDRIFGPG